MIDRVCGGLSIARQCGLLGISRSTFYHAPCGESEENLALMRRIDGLFLEHPFFGSRQMARALRRGPPQGAASDGADNFVAVASILGVTGITDETALESAETLITA